MADLSEIPTTVRDSDSVDVVAPDVQRVDLLDEEEGGNEFGRGYGIEEEGVNYEDDMFEIDEEGGEEDYEDDYEAQFLALQVCSPTQQLNQTTIWKGQVNSFSSLCNWTMTSGVKFA